MPLGGTVLMRRVFKTLHFAHTEHYRRSAMTAKQKEKSRILDAVHETAQDLHRLGFIEKRKQCKFG